MNTNILNNFATLITLGCLLTACSSAPKITTQTTTLNGKTQEFSFTQKRPPTIVFLNGGGPVKLKTWAPVYHELAKTNSVFSYYRLGAGKSDATSQPRTVDRVVARLHKLIKQQKIDKPLILVGHSLGGLYANHYARKYPREVRAVVMVDPTHPELNARVEKAGLKQSAFMNRLVKWYGKVNPTRYSEIENAKHARRAMNKAGPFPNIPLIVISAGKRQGNKQHNEVFNQLHQELARLSPQGKYIVATNAGHIIPRDDPEIIIQSIKTVLRK